MNKIERMTTKWYTIWEPETGCDLAEVEADNEREALERFALECECDSVPNNWRATEQRRAQ